MKRKIGSRYEKKTRPPRHRLARNLNFIMYPDPGSFSEQGPYQPCSLHSARSASVEFQQTYLISISSIFSTIKPPFTHSSRRFLCHSRQKPTAMPGGLQMERPLLRGKYGDTILRFWKSHCAHESSILRFMRALYNSLRRLVLASARSRNSGGRYACLSG